MKKLLAVLVAVVVALPAFGQSVTLPAEIKGSVGAWIIIAPERVDGGAPRWRVDAGLQEVRLDLLLPPEMLSKLKGKVVTSTTPGKYKVECWNAKGDLASDIATCWVTIGTPGPTPPVPPGPNPPIPPPDIDPAPIPLAGLHVLIVEDKEKLSLLPPAQLSIRTSKVFRDYLDANCALEPDGKTKAYRIWDYKTDAGADRKIWQDALTRAKGKSLPWIIVSNSPSGGYEGPLPANTDETIALLKKIKGN